MGGLNGAVGTPPVDMERGGLIGCGLMVFLRSGTDLPENENK